LDQRAILEAKERFSNPNIQYGISSSLALTANLQGIVPVSALLHLVEPQNTE
jgi:hypothetical protein